jgi:hypothetical protein
MLATSMKRYCGIVFSLLQRLVLGTVNRVMSEILSPESDVLESTMGYSQYD